MTTPPDTRDRTRPCIEGKPLTPDDLERNVTFTYRHGRRVFGKLSSYREDGAIFVRFAGPGGELCDAELLTWG